MPILLGLDLGTTSVAAVAIDEQSRVIRSATRAHGAYVSGLPEGYAEQDFTEILKTARNCLLEVLASCSESPRGLGLTGQMHGFLFCDQHRQPISRLITWQDRRCLLENSNGRPPLEELRDLLPDGTQRKLGCQIRAGYAIATWFAMRQRNELPASDYLLCDITAAIAHELIGQPLRMDPTFAASWGVWDQTSNTYCEDVLAVAGMKETVLPETATTGEQLGVVRRAIADFWQLPEGMPVYAGIGDNQASFLGAVEDAQSEVLVNIGTGGQVAWSSPAQTDHPAIEIRPYLDDHFLHVGAGLAGGDAYAWLVSQLRRWLEELGIAVAEQDIHQQLAAAHAGLSDEQQAAAPVCEPFFRGTRLDPARRGLLRNLGQDNVGLGQLVHAVISGVIDSLCEMYEAAESPLQNRERVVVAGNFFEHHRWAADRIGQRWGIPVRFPTQQEQAARGAALLALRGM